MLRYIGFVIAVAAACQPAGTGVISGLVLAHGSDEPVRKAVVIVEKQGSPRAWAEVQTDASGRFVVESLPPGQFTVNAAKEGAGAGSWGSANDVASGKLLTLAAGEHRSDVVIRLIRPAVITGTVIDVNGEPMVNAQVQLLRTGYPRGTRELVPRAFARANDRGEYRFANVGPGKVYIAAEVHGFYPHFGGERPPIYSRQFYPGVTDWKRATAISVQSGAQIRGINMTLTPLTTISIRGKLSGLPPPPAPVSGAPSPEQFGAGVQLYSRDRSLAAANVGSGVDPQSGRFELQPVAPGRYWLTATATVGGRTLWASEKVDVQNDPEEINLALAPPAAIKGKVTVEGESPAPIDQLTVELLPIPPPGRPSGPLRVKPQKDGTFVFPAVPPGVWDINVQPIAKGGFIKSMRLGDQDVLTEEMEVGTDTSEPLNIVISSRGGKVSGQLAADQGKTTTAVILLAPEEKYQHVVSFFAMRQTGPDGKFELTGITPGKYRVYAIEMSRSSIDPRNPDILSKLSEYSETLEIGEGASVSVTPKLIPAETFQEAAQ